MYSTHHIFDDIISYHIFSKYTITLFYVFDMSDMSRCFFCICVAYRHCSFHSLRTTHELPALQPSHPDAQKEARAASFSCARHTEVCLAWLQNWLGSKRLST